MLISRTSFILFFAILLCLFLATLFLFSSPKADTRQNISHIPLLDYMVVHKERLRIPVLTHGTTQAKIEIPLVSEVRGKVISVNENFATGGFFKQGDVLLRLNPTEYELDIIKKRSVVDAASLKLKEAEARAAVAAKSSRGHADLGLHIPQLRHAKSQLAAAEAELQLVKYKLEQTQIRAPFDGRIKKVAVGLGQYLRQGEVIANLYAIDNIEVRIPISDRQLALLERGRFSTARNKGSFTPYPVAIKGQFANEIYIWQGQVVRSEGGRDSNGLLYLVARVEKPYLQNEARSLEPGMFVEVEIYTGEMAGVAVLPPQALRDGNQVWTVNSNSRLRVRPVELLHRGRSEIYVQRGLNQGDRVVLGDLDLVVDNMQVKLRDKSVVLGGLP